MMNFEDIKDSIICKVVNTENYKEFLADKPNESIDDMSVVYATVLSEQDGQRLTLPISNDMMNEMGVSQNQLKETALANMSEQDYTFKSMREVLIESMFPEGVPENDPFVDMMLPPEDPEMQMYVLTNGCSVNGAAEILNQKAMDEISDKLGGDFVVLPSSVHETIILPLRDEMDSAMLESMVQEINSGVLNEPDKLSDHVFQYDSKEHELVRMDKMQERKQEKEASKSDISEGKSDKVDKAKTDKAAPQKSSSLQDRISKKQAEVDKRKSTKPQPTKKKDVALA